MPTFETPEPIAVTIELGVADVRFATSNRTDTVVSVTPSDPAKPADVAAAEETRVRYNDGVLEIKAPRGWSRNSFRRGGESIDVRVELPSGSQVQGETGVGTLRCTGTLSQCRYTAGVGDLTVEHVAGDASLTTGTGAVRIDTVGGNAAVKNPNGDTWIGEVLGELGIRSANGKVTVQRAAASVTVKTANGDIELAEVARGVIVAETACGKVEVAVQPGVAAWLELHTGFGRVRNLLGDGQPPQPSAETVEVRARTAIGDITIRRADTDLATAAPAAVTPETASDSS